MDHIFFLNINIGTYLNLKFQIADENGVYEYISKFGSSIYGPCGVIAENQVAEMGYTNGQSHHTPTLFYPIREKLGLFFLFFYVYVVFLFFFFFSFFTSIFFKKIYYPKV